MTENSRPPPASAHLGTSSRYLKATFDQLYEEGATTPALMSVGLHPRISGRPARARALADFLDHILKHDSRLGLPADRRCPSLARNSSRSPGATKEGET